MAEKPRKGGLKWYPLCLKAGDHLIPLDNIQHVVIGSIEQAEVEIVTHAGVSYTALGFDALEAVMIFKPSALEGRRLRWKKGAWAFHNIFGHPVMQFLAWIGLGRLAVKLHDATTPTPRGFR